LVPLATEVNQFKIGRVTPGTHIPVVDETTLGAPPDYYLVLAWNFVDYLRKKYDGYLKKGGHFIVPVPELQVLGPIEQGRGQQVDKTRIGSRGEQLSARVRFRTDLRRC